MPLTAGSNHSAPRGDSELFVGLTRELLERGCNVRFRAAGTSMHPTIRDGEVVTVAPSSGDAFAVGDVLLCRHGRRPTAHRVVAVQPSDDGQPLLHLRGDNLGTADGPVRAADVIGRVLTVSRDGSEQSVDGPGRLVRLRRIARWFFAAAIVLTTVMGASDASAQIGQTLTWVGGSTANWSTRQNWSPEAIPAARDNLIFPPSLLFKTTINDVVGLSVNSITIQDGYTISGLALEITGDPGLLVESAVAVVAITLDLSLNRGADPVHVADNAGILELSGHITARNFVKQGPGTLVLSGANPDITDLIGEDGCGVIRATNPLALGVSLVGRILLGQNCTLQVDANTTLDKPIIVNGIGAPGTLGALVIAAGVNLTERLELRLDSPARISVLTGATLDVPFSTVGVTMNLNSPLTVNVEQAGVAIISRVISGISGLTKEGAGLLILDKNNTYNGQTTIKGGTLRIDGIQPDSPVLLDGGTLSGGNDAGSLGSISTTPNGGTISVGRGGVEIMKSGDVTMNAATTFEVEFSGSQFDKLVVSGSVALNGAVLSVLGQFPPNQAVTILDNDSNDAVTGTFAGVPENSRVMLAGVPFRISYKGGTGNDVVLTPEVLAVPGYEVLTGTYVGNGANGRPITGLGFHPDLVIVKAGGNSIAEAIAKTSTMPAGSKRMGTGDFVTDGIQSLDPDGFTVGTGGEVNQNSVLYQWTAWKAFDGEMTVGTYIGNPPSQQITGLGFSPAIVFVFQGALGNTATPEPPVHKNSAMSAATAFSFAGGTVAGSITALDADGFTVGTHNSVNQNNRVYHYVAWKEIQGKIDVGTYTGAVGDNRNINGVGFQPDFVMVQSGAGTQEPVAHSTAMGPSTDTSHVFNGQGNRANLIQQLRPDGFQVGTLAEVNANNVAYTYAAWGRAAPTAVRMATMSARRTATGVVVEWRTGYEADNLGFHVYRGPDNARVRLTTSLLAGSALQQSSGMGAGASDSYRWSDETAGARAPDVEYWVEGISLNGKRTLYGPVRPEAMSVGAAGADASGTVSSKGAQIAAASAAPPAAASSPLRETTGTAVSPAQRTSAPARGVSRPAAVAPLASTDPLRVQWSIAAHAAVKIDITSRGWYRVTQPELVAAGLPGRVDPAVLQLFVDGVEQSLRVNGAANGRFNQRDSVEFYATGADTPYTGTRTYWLVAGDAPGQSLPVVDGRQGGVAGPTSFPSSFELKPRTIFFGALENGDTENFFGPLIVPGASTSQVLDLPDVIAPAPGAAQVEVALQGVTDVDHRVGVRVNGVDVGEVTFTGRDAGVRIFTIAQALLIDGANTVSLDARGGDLDNSLVDDIRVTYQRRYRARANTLTFIANAGQRVAVGGFTDAGIRVFDITGDVASQEVRGKVASDGAGWKVTLAIPGTGPRTLIAVATGAEASPAALRANVPSILHRASQAGDIVMIAPAAFQPALAPLKAFRESQGHTVRLVDIEDVYDEFSFGGKTPYAIRDFMVRATRQWSVPPRFLLLVGNATEDPRDYFGLGEPDYVPTKVVETGAIESASDDWFVDADNDGYADMAFVGRLPARSEAQVAAMVSKIIAYEQAAAGDWQQSVVLVSDRDPTGETDFAALVDRALQVLPDAEQVTDIRRDIDPDAGAALKARLSEGAALVSYAGHGSVASWRLDLLTTDDVPMLTNGSKLPIVIALACLNGMFDSLFPEESLAEALVRAPNGGAVGVWASSGITSPQWQWRMNVELYRQIFQGGWLTIGEAMRAAKAVVGDPDVRRTWIYFGDPVTRFAGLPGPPAATTAGAVPTATPPRLGAALGRGDTTNAERVTGPVAPSPRAGVRLADFDRDGRADLFLVEPRSGQWVRARGGPADVSSLAGQWSVPGEPMALDLNGDGGSDLFVYDASTGAWLQAISMLDGRFITYPGSWRRGYRLASGDFDGDGRHEIFGLSAETGDWFEARSDGRGGFTYRTGSGLHDGAVHVADFNGDGRDDVLVYDPSSGRWTVMWSGAKGPTFESGNWGAGWDVTVTDLNGDRRADVLLSDAGSGQWVAYVLDRAVPLVYAAGAWAAGGLVQPLDRDGDGRHEIFNYDAGTGRWTLTAIRPSGKVIVMGGVWEAGWSIASGDLDGDGRDDLLLYNPETGQVVRRLSRGSTWQDEPAGAWPAHGLMVGRRP